MSTKKLQIIGSIGSNVEIDATLTQEGAAADAKAVGEALEQKQPVGDYAEVDHDHALSDLSGVLSVEKGGVGYGTIEDTTYTTARYRASALVSTETAPTTNGVINWLYQ